MSAAQIRWDIVERIAQTPDHLFLYVGAMKAIVVPKASFESQVAAESFFETAQRLRQEAHARTPDLSAPAPWVCDGE